MNPRILLAAVLAVALAAAAVLVFAEGDGPAPNTPRPGASTADDDAGTDEPSRGATRRAVETAREPTTNDPSPTASDGEGDAGSSDPDGPGPDEEQAATGGIRVRAVDATTGDFEMNFRVVPIKPWPGLPNERIAKPYTVEIEIPLEPGESGTFRVEAEGFVPSDPITEVRQPGETWRDVDVRLVPATRATGVRLLLRDERLSPVGHLRVTANRRALGAPTAPYTSAWTRETEAADGSYELPDLEPGSWQLKLVALDAEGGIRPLIPALVEFDQDGGARVERAVDLEPGTIVSLEVRDPATGRALDRVPVRLEHPDGREIQTRWIHRDPETGRRTAANGGLPAAARCELEDPLRPGRYLLKVQLPDGQVRERELLLRPSTREDVTL